MVRFVLSLFANPSSALCTLVQGGIFVLALRWGYGGTRSCPRWVQAAPGLLVTTGIFGTFLGIFVGLMDFDVRHIDTSIPALLEGMKLAFSTSVVGMFGAILLKILESLQGAPLLFLRRSPLEVPDAPAEPTGADLIQALRGMRDAQQETNRLFAEGMESLRRSLSGEDDASLATLLRRLRGDLVDADKERLRELQSLREDTRQGFQEMGREFRHFAETVAENNSKALLEALRDVIRDFNVQLNEQFGENFKELNGAVGRLLEWQEHYRQELAALRARLEDNLSALERSEQALGALREHAEAIPEALVRWTSVLQTLETQTRAAQETLSALASLRQEAGRAVPELAEHLGTLTDTLRTGMEKAFSEVRTQSRDLLETLRRESAKSQAELLKTSAQLSEGLLGAQEGVREAGRKVQEVAVQMGQDLSRSMSEANQMIQKEFRSFDEAMEQELKSAIEQMGSHLASLSAKFVGDYTPLAGRMAELVKLARTPETVAVSGRS